MSISLASRSENSTLANLLHNRASRQPDRMAYTFLEDGEKESASLTYQQLDEKARAIAAYWQSRLSLGERVLLVYLQGLESTDAPDRITCPSHSGNTRSRAELVV